MIDRERLISILGALIALGASSLAGAAEFVTPSAGGTGGDHSYNLDCGNDGVLVGFSGKWGSWMDSIGIICRKINADGTLGSSFAVGPRGGNGGNEAGSASCEPANVVQLLSPYTGSYINSLGFTCGTWSPATRTVARPPARNDDADVKRVGASGTHIGSSNSRLECPTDGKPGVGIRGKYGSYVDSIALTCDAVAVASTVAKPGAGTGTAPVAGTPAAAPVIKFDQAPAAGSAVPLSAMRGGDIEIRASGGTAALSMTLSVTDGSYRPYFELVTPPPAAPLPTSVKPAPTLTIGAQTAGSQTASIARIVRLRANTPRIMGMNLTSAIPIIVTVQNSNGAAAARSFIVTLQP